MTTTLQTIESKDVTLSELFTQYFVVPDFQREYVWGNDEVRQLLDDVYAEFADASRAKDSEYFIGTIVTCLDEDDVHQLIDGQQRMTTAYLVLCAIRDYMKEIHGTEIQALGPQISAVSVDQEGRDRFRYRLALQYEDSCGVLEGLAKGTPPENLSKSTASVRNIANAYSVIRSYLAEQFKDEASLRRFYAYFTQKVKLIRVKTISVAHALKTFETINDRGLGLNPMDLLKNLLFMQSQMKDFERLKVQWKKVVDPLDNAREKPLRFLRYFIFSNYEADRLREEEIYDWFRKHKDECGYEKNPFDFVAELIGASDAYTRFVGGLNIDGSANRYLANIKAMSGSARQHLILLLAARKLPINVFTTLCFEIENLFFAYVITREATREFERKFAEWAPLMRAVSSESQLRDFVRDYFDPEKKRLAFRFEQAMLSLTQDSLQQYRLRYVLAKLTQYVNEQAFGAGTESNLASFTDSSIHIEHILPQNPSREALAEFDKPEETKNYIGRLGNLALAEETINCSLGNGAFSAKRPEYDKSTFLLTRLLAGPISLGDKTALNRAVEGFPTFAKWSSTSIVDRQKALTTLALKVWVVPTPNAQAAS